MVIGFAIGGLFDGTPIIQSGLGWLLLFFGTLIAALALFMMNWFFAAVITRADLIHKLEERFHGFDMEFYVALLGKEAPKGEIGIGAVMLGEWSSLPRALGFLFLGVGLTLCVTMGNVGLAITEFQSPLYWIFAAVTLAMLFVFLYLLYTNESIGSKYVDTLRIRDLRERFNRIKSQILGDSIDGDNKAL